MSEVLVFSSSPVGDVISALESVGNKDTFRSMNFTADTIDGDFSDLPYIVICMDAKNFDASIGTACNTLNNFIKNNNIKSNIPVIPIVYGSKSKNSYLEDELINFIKEYPSLNLLKNGLFWSKEEPASDFINKMKKAEYKAGYSVSRSRLLRGDDYDDSGKSLAISQLVNSVLSALIGFVLGTTAGGLIGGLVIGGVAATLIGTGIGLVVGPLIGLLITTVVFNFISFVEYKKLADKREVDLQRNELWESLKANLFLADSQSRMAPLYALSNSETQDNKAIQIEKLSSDEELSSEEEPSSEEAPSADEEVTTTNSLSSV